MTKVLLTITEDEKEGISIHLEAKPALAPGQQMGFAHQLGLEATRHVEKILDAVTRQSQAEQAQSQNGDSSQAGQGTVS